ncbi:MAG: hypothetical protein OXN95_01315 [bacterium]|nr:hypothetical protein [bacterium]
MAEIVSRSSDECQICNLNSRLIEDGAESVSWSDLWENECHLYVRTSTDHGCIHGLRLDIQGAEYRRISKGKDTRMCDFSVVAVLGNAAQLIAIELKGGVAYSEEIEQLVEGLRVLHEYFQENDLVARPEACWVVGREVEKLSFSLRDKLTSLRFGSETVRLHLLECGEVLHL